MPGAWAMCKRLLLAVVAVSLLAGGDAAAVLRRQRAAGEPNGAALAAAPAAAPAGKPTGVASPGLAHFLNGVPGLLRSSGERVGSAVQRILEVQGSLDDLRDDLSTEYKLWKGKKAGLLEQRDAVSNQIKQHEAALLAQKSARTKAERLRADLAAAVQEGGKLNASRDDARRRSETAQADLQKEIADIQQEIERERVERWKVINATHNRTEEVLRRQQRLQSETLNTSAAVQRTEEARAAQKTNFSQQQSRLLEQAATARRQIGALQQELQEQSKLLVDSRRLANQAAKVAAQRQQLEAQAVNCTAALQRVNDEVAALVQSERTDTAELQRCQALDAENQKMQARINECRVAAIR